jgi:excisionase family DNA binding protein
MTNSIILENVSADDLKTIIAETVKAGMIGQQPKVKEEVYLTRFEVAKAFRVSLPTLNTLTKTGRVRAYKIGGRILYKQVDIEASLVEIQTSKYRR